MIFRLDKAWTRQQFGHLDTCLDEEKELLMHWFCGKKSKRKETVFHRSFHRLVFILKSDLNFLQDITGFSQENSS